uniref:Uncharacterized protein n=1 Tax=Sinocyclocheilus grahami TaxID=75366 RepID=A0A672SRC8_SINGR
MEVDVLVGNTTVLDEDVYQLWLDGHTQVNTIRMETGALQECEANAEVLHGPVQIIPDVRAAPPVPFQSGQSASAPDPSSLSNHLLVRASLLDQKDFDDISSKTGIALKSCRRQVLHTLHVFKVVEELKGPLVENTQHHFLLSDVLTSHVSLQGLCCHSVLC